jgi:hypothetical protein
VKIAISQKLLFRENRYFAKIAISRSFFRERLTWLRFTPNFVGLTPAPRGRSPLICEKIEQHLWKFKLFKYFYIAISRNCYFSIFQKIDRFSPNFVGLTPAPRVRSSPICEKIHEHFIIVNCPVYYLLKCQFFSVLFWYLMLLGFFLQIRDDLPLGAGVNPTKFGVNRSQISFSLKSSKYREITIFTIKIIWFFCKLGTITPWGRWPILQNLG